MNFENLGHGNGISEAGDVVPVEGMLYEGSDLPSNNDEIAEGVTEASRRLVDEADADAAFEAPEEQISEAERRYDIAAETAAEITQTGPFNNYEAWEEADEDGKIRRDYLDELAIQQDVINRQANDASRLAAHDKEMVRIMAISDPVAREKALSELSAREQLARDKLAAARKAFQHPRP